ncbi:MAG: hypothetical protein DRN04_11430 [Thermoprotei archaeon]|nr:MAG: hypothetical protein DRN04_11430 [Thermoprotei archaeon]
MSYKPPSVKGLRIRKEVLEGRYEPAIALSNIVKGKAPKFILDPAEFFKRTHVTETMGTLIVKTLMGLLGKTKLEVGGRTYVMYSKLIILPSLFGGGKSHSLAVLYHLLNIIRNVEDPEKARAIIKILDEEIANFVYKYWNELKSIGIKCVVVDGPSTDFAPVPEDGREVKTIWGYIAQQLGRYSVIARYDKNVAPSREALKAVLDDSGAVVLIDEIARYYCRTKELDKDVINSFLMNLTEVLTTEEIRRCVVVITLPYDVEKGIVEEAHAGAIKAEIIKKIIDRVGSGNTIPVVTTVDLPSILRKRIFEEDEETLRKYGRALADMLFENASEVAREFIRRKGGLNWLREEFERSYPFHPETINVLRLLHTYLSKYIQATRNPIRMASEAVLAIRRGLYDWLGYTPYLVMPFHIPIVLERVLTEAFPLSTPSELGIFKEILEKDVVHPIKGEAGEIKLGDNIREKVPKDYHVPSFMVTAYIWLRSLAGGGLVSNIEAYPSTEDVAWALIDLETVSNREWMEVARILRGLHGKLAYLTEYSGRWLFRRIPFLESLIEEKARDILPNIIHGELASYLDNLRERGKSEYKIEVLKDAQYVFIKYGEEAKLPDDLDVNKPTIVVFAREARDDEVAKVLERNNVVVLRPDTEREISEEDLKARPELKKYRTYWEALMDVLRYLKACERVTDDVLKTEYIEEISRAEEVFALLRSKRDRLRTDYDELRSFLLPRVYYAVYLRRAGRLKKLEGLSIRSDAPLGYAIEVVLQKENYLKKELKGNELEEIIKTYLNIDIREKKDGVAISDIWNFFLTNTTVEEIPVLPFSALMNAVYEMVRSLDYAVKINSRIYWKTVYNSKEDANLVLSMSGKDIGEDTVKTIRKLMVLLQRTGQVARIVYWEHILDDWLRGLKPKEGYRIVILTPTREVKTLEELKTEYNWEEILKDSALFYEKLKVDIDLELPKETSLGKEFTGTLKVTSSIYRGKVKIQIISPKVVVSEKEFVSELPVDKDLTMKVPEEVVEEEVPITVVVYSEKGEELGRETFTIALKLPPPPVPPVLKRREWLSKKAILKLIEEGKPITIYGVRSSNIGNLVILPSLVSGKLKLSMEVSSIGGVEEAKATFNVENLPVEKTSLIQVSAIGVSRLGKTEETTITIEFDKPLSSKDIDVNEFPDDVEFDAEYEVR